MQLGRGSCLCENAWTKAQMVDLGCGLGTSVPVQPVSSTVDVRHASDGDPTTCVNLAAARYSIGCSFPFSVCVLLGAFRLRTYKCTVSS